MAVRNFAMDSMESDESECWEDFFGSTTELTPSLIEFYDSLTENLKSDCNPNGSTDTLTEEPVQYDNIFKTNVGPGKCTCVLSPNVQRLIAHTDSIVDTTNVVAKRPEAGRLSPAPKRSTNGHLVKLSQIPLTKNISKLTLSSNDLVQTFHSSSEYLDADERRPTPSTTNLSVVSPMARLVTASTPDLRQPIKLLRPPSIIVTSTSSVSVNDSSSIGSNSSSLPKRPMSICSTTSSSSSGSEALNEKLGPPSYLASVESLADPSDLEAHSRLTVFERACLEIIDSERSYVQDLGQVIDGYLGDWRERACLKLDEQKTLFSNIEDIYEFNSTFFNQLYNASMDPIKIAKCFIEMKERFQVYTDYCTSYPEAISLLTSLLQASHTNSLLTSTQKMLQHTLPLGSYLLKPVQRILKYHLLLNNLLKHCDYREVNEAYEIMRQVANNIDQMKKKLEQQSRVKQLSGILDGWLGPELTVLGELKHEGKLMENNKPRMAFLFETMMIIAKPKEDSRLQLKSFIYRNNLMLCEHLPGEPTSFNVIPFDDPRNQIKLTARNKEQKRIWADNIKTVAFGSLNIPSRAKELLFQLGKEEDRPDDKNPPSKWLGSTQSSAPTYLEIRNQFRRSKIRTKSKSMKKSNSFVTSISRPNSSFDENASMDDSVVSEDIDTKSCTHVALRETRGRDDLTVVRNKRSKSAPRSPTFYIDDVKLDEEKKTRTGFKPVEVKKYNTKTMPERIAHLKRNKSQKETFTFYIQASEIGETVLKITESTERLDEIAKEATEETEDAEEPKEDVHPAEESSQSLNKNDSQIISDLLKEHKDFNRIHRRSQKKRTSEIIRQHVVAEKSEPEEIPRPPSVSPPPLDSDEPITTTVTDPAVAKTPSSEHIYETLLRNVHVPYQYSPVLNRSKTQPYYSKRDRSSKLAKPIRPDSDYATLVYDANLAKFVASDASSPKPEVLLSNSDSKINYDGAQRGGGSKAPFTASASFDGSFGQTTKQISSSAHPEKSHLIATNRRKHKSMLFDKNIIKLPERRVSDVTGMCRQTIIHRQGSESVGERMANSDYADPRSLFRTTLIKSAANVQQRDSVVSLTSSSDSVCDKKPIPINAISPQFDYEHSVEESLERDFRDSAIYSDDKEEPMVHLRMSLDLCKPQIPPKPLNIPPKYMFKFAMRSNSTPITTLVRSSHNQSWVLQQIRHFEK